MPTLQELLKQQFDLNRQIAQLRLTERAKAIAQIHSILDLHGLAMADVTMSASAGRASWPKVVKKVAPKYRDPVQGATWTGRGLKPKWLSEELARGKQLSDFAL